VHVQRVSPVRLSLKLVSVSPVTETEIDTIKKLIEELINDEVEIEVVNAILR